MHRLSERPSKRSPGGDRLQAPAVRTYRQIARILAKREGTPITPAQVKRDCQAAERKIIRALLADPVIQEWPDLAGSARRRTIARGGPRGAACGGRRP